MTAAPFDYAAPASLDEAVTLLAGREGALVLAGGHSLLPAVKQRQAAPSLLVDLRKLGTLRTITAGAGGGLRIGAMVTLAELAGNADVRERYAALADAAEQVGDPQVRNRATIVGNVLQHDRPTDLPAVLVAYGASLVVHGAQGATLAEDLLARDEPLRRGEIVTAVDLPAPAAKTGAAYAKISDAASAYPLVGVAAVVVPAGDGTVAECRVAVVGTRRPVVRARTVEESLAGSPPATGVIDQAAATVDAELDFIDDMAASAGYREHLARVLTERAVSVAARRAGL